MVAASNSDLVAGVKKGTFREDLFYRLQVVPIAIAPLRERRSDIPLLVEYFLSRLHVRLNGRHWTVSQAAMVSLWSYDWPGNVRELENMIERLVIMCEGEVDRHRPVRPPAIVATARAAEDHVPTTLTEAGINLNAMVRELEGRMIGARPCGRPAATSRPRRHLVGVAGRTAAHRAADRALEETVGGRGSRCRSTSSAKWSGQWPGVAIALDLELAAIGSMSPSANVSSIGTPASRVSALPTTLTPKRFASPVTSTT